MPISEAQLETWAHQGSISQSADTYATIKGALLEPGAPYEAQRCKVFLQGSYGNDTNIYAESDVDVVIMCPAAFHHDLSSLPANEKEAFRATHSDAQYGYTAFKEDVIERLRSRFGSAMVVGEKAVKVKRDGSRRNTDVLITNEFRRYRRFQALDDQDFESGICFFTSSGVRVANYPQQHSRNCVAKQQATNGRFKPMVRIFKNLRTSLVERGRISPGVAPSYYVESLLYNAPDELFGGKYSEAFVRIVNWFGANDRSKFVCANRQYWLFKGDPHVTWSSEKYDQFFSALVAAWQSW